MARRRDDISFCAIVRNAGGELHATLGRVAPLVDELVIVDTGSRDNTLEIARNFGARIFATDWPGDFAAARNIYLELARCSWVLSLDADEMLGPITRDELRELVRRGPRTAFAFTIRNHFSIATSGLPHAPSEFAGETEPGVGFTISRTVRLFPRARGVAYTFPIHESLVPSLRRRRIPIKLLRSPWIDHMGYLADPDARAERIATYKELGEQKVAQFPHYAGGYLELARLHLWDGDLDAAADLFRECIRRSPGCALAHYFYVLAQSWSGRRTVAARHLAAALTLLPRNSDLLFLRGMLAIEAGDAGRGAVDVTPALNRISLRNGSRLTPSR